MSAGRTEPVLPRAGAKPTDKRAGRSIQPHVVTCPFCPREGTASVTIQLCHGCGHWFEVVIDGGASDQ